MNSLRFDAKFYPTEASLCSSASLENKAMLCAQYPEKSEMCLLHKMNYNPKMYSRMNYLHCVISRLTLWPPSEQWCKL